MQDYAYECHIANMTNVGILIVRKRILWISKKQDNVTSIATYQQKNGRRGKEANTVANEIAGLAHDIRSAENHITWKILSAI